MQEPVTDEQVRKVFERTGKPAAEDQLNCGACGCNSRYDQAVAVVRKMAEPDMCVPYMRRLAEQRADRVHLMVGRGADPANESLGFKQQGILRRDRVVPLLVEKLRARGKLVVTTDV